MSSDVRPYSRVSDVERLRALERLNILDTPPEPEFDGIVQLARRVCSVPVALISLVASDRQWFKARAGLDASETPINQSVCAYALEEDELLVIPDQGHPLVSSGPQIRFYAGAVLRSFEGQPLGALCVIDDRPRPEGLTADQADLYDGKRAL